MKLPAFLRKLFSQTENEKEVEANLIPSRTSFVRNGERQWVVSHHEDEVVVQSRGHLVAVNEQLVRPLLEQQADLHLLSLFETPPTEPVDVLIDQILLVQPESYAADGRPRYNQSLETYIKLLKYGPQVPLYCLEWW